ncbi:MAG: Cache 3/Cache 2 fusion domain-containing protein [Bacteriovorax sp.]|nr:Cache 3/Cache 2 fusion domain-containing protein [Bacteriovorax sp.]
MKFTFAIFFIMTLITNVFAAGDTKVALETLKSKLNRYGAPKTDGVEEVLGKKVAALYFGKKKINNSFDAVDDVKKSHGGTATIFVKDGQDFVRVSTNVLKDDGTRAAGTTLAHNKAYDSIVKGETFCGDVEILGSTYDTCYEPIKDAAGGIVGIYYVGYKK